MPFAWRNVAVQGDGRARCHLTVTADHTNRYGMLHGGMLSTVADTLLGSVVYHATGGVPIATIYLNTEFIGAAREGDWVEGVATLRKKGRRVVFTQGEFHVGDKLIASSAGAWAIIGA